jgi:NADH-quinone oxidoreductase subunit K
MIPANYFLAVSFAIFTIGVVGIAVTRNFLIMILSAEISLAAATLLAATFFYYNTYGNILMLLFAIWTIAAAEAITLGAFYRYLSKFETSMDVTKLSKLKER